MIRRRQGNSFWLITQPDHAKLAGELARQFGNQQFQKPDPYEQTMLAVTQHDAGWQAIDAKPPLNPGGLPLDVFEAPRSVTHRAWLGSAKIATDLDPYAGLLVTLHQLSLSSMSVSTNQPSRFDVQQLRQQFELNKFQHAMIEHLEKLRGQLGFATDKPLRLGLAEGWSDPAEDNLKHHFRLLQAMDLLSLAVCCTTPPEFKTGQLHTRPGSAVVQLQIHRPVDSTLLVKPWPFERDEIEVSVPYRAVPAEPFASADELAARLADAPVKQLEVTLQIA